jgi:NAD(P)-dependent dehydrogenase (short-subunit alcohol dehydrogenase family)
MRCSGSHETVVYESNMVPWCLVSPTSRGIGFALARHLLETTNAPCVATVRKDTDAMKERLLSGLNIDASRLTVLKLDVLGTPKRGSTPVQFSI